MKIPLTTYAHIVINSWYPDISAVLNRIIQETELNKDWPQEEILSSVINEANIGSGGHYSAKKFVTFIKERINKLWVVGRNPFAEAITRFC